MLRKVTWLVVFASVLLVAPLSAQDKRVEVSFLAGWTFSDGIDSGGEVFITPFGSFDRIDPKDSFKWGITGGFLVTENAEIGFQYGNQPTQFEISGPLTEAVEIGDISISTYHGYFAYNFFPEDAPIRPYALFGLGATNFGSLDITRPDGSTASIGGSTYFSTTWAAGVKFYFHPNVAARAGVQWTPTYIKSDATGYWCDPWWGCYLVGDAQYSSQWDINGGVTFRF
jgi:opacity protein-like surface antigen